EATLDGFQTQPGALLGTIAYMAPEQARGEEMDFRAHAFSCGAVLYEIATAALIFDGRLHREPPRPSSVNPAVPAALETVIARALAKDPAQRYPSMAGLRDDLRRLWLNEK